MAAVVTSNTNEVVSSVPLTTPASITKDGTTGAAPSVDVPASPRTRAGQVAEPAALHDKSCRVYVGNLAWKVQWQNLKDHMRSLGGNVIRADVFVDGQGRSRGCGIVEYETPEQAQEAIAKLTDTELFDRKIFVREDREDDPEFRVRRGGVAGAGRPAQWSGNRGLFPNGRSAGSYRGGRGTGYASGGAPAANEPRTVPEDQVNCRVFVGNLAWKVSWQDLKDLFRGCGDVVRADVYMQNGRSRGCGTVLFKTPAEAQTAVDHFNEYDLDGRPMLVRIDEGPQPRQPRA